MSDKEVWYKGGLHFSCTECGDCCKGPGFVWVDQPAIRTIARYLDIPAEEFLRRYTRPAGDRITIGEKANYDCFFWEDEIGCTIYEVRPEQCRTFPFWPENLRKEKDWKYTVKHCPGSGTGNFYPADLIQKIMKGEVEASMADAAESVLE
ncbi:MAG: YkgJ family cysteine cluster protein [Planctomycetota bacterium]|jgi:hypothetical protein|nr:YkgJ family cysteine cluster protein [Planctomycetota bacterium]MDP7131839.1 YkgJ family cysteine cluster protein [Planctomycetota bacterium]